MSEHGAGPVQPDLTEISKFLSFVLRHAPDSIGLRMDAGGWVEVDELIELAGRKQALSRELLAEVVDGNTKQRFALSPDGKRIRANQGHSIEVDLGLTPICPPDTLFHGTAARFLDAIRSEGLRAGDRNHVHLSGDRQTALAVGRRHGKAVVLTVDCASMQHEGSMFYRSENGVWLTDSVPARHLFVEP